MVKDLSALRLRDDARAPGEGGRRGWIIAAALALVILAVAAVVIARGSAAEVTVAQAGAPGSGGPASVLNASGYVTPRRRATVAAKVTGRVSEVLVDEGMVVAAGQVLARIDDSDARRRLEAAEAELRVAAAMVRDLEVNLTNAERELRRARDLQRDGVASDQALDQARTSAESLRARLAVAREQVHSAEAQAAVYRQDLENYTVRAPFAGIAVSKDAQPGEMVSPVSAGGGFTRTGISTIVDMGSLEVEVDVNESYIARVVPGQPVEATLDAYPDWHIPSSVRTVIPTADRQKATVKVRITFSQLDPRILPDMGVKVAFLEQVRDGEKNPVRSAVPSGAVRQADGSSVVFVVKDGRAERRAVTIGRDLNGAREILAGVEPGESVVVDGPAALRDGAKVKIK